MTEQDDTGTTLPLAEGFAPATAEQWWGLVGAVLRRSGGLAEAPDPATAEAMLSTTTYDGVRIRPLYTADDAAPDSGFPGVAPYRPGQPADRPGQGGLGRPPVLRRPGRDGDPAGGADRPRERRDLALARRRRGRHRGR